MADVVAKTARMSVSPPTSPVVSKRGSQQLRRKPVPIATFDVDVATLCDDPRYPPFDTADPFAPLSELRRRSYTIALEQTCNASAPFDLPEVNPIIFPSGRRYTLTVAKPRSLPDLLSPFEKLPSSEFGGAVDPFTPGGREGVEEDYSSHNGREGKGIGIYEDKRGSSKKHQNQNQFVNQRRHSHSSLLSRITPSTQSDAAPRRAHYIPRKSSQLSNSYTNTPPLTPDLSVSGSSSSNSDSSLLEVMVGSSMPRPTVHDADFQPSKKIMSPAVTFVRRLLPRRSAGSLVPPRQDQRELPPLPKPSTSSAPVTRSESAPSIPFPHTSASMDISLDIPPVRSQRVGTSSSQQTLVADIDGYQTEPESLRGRALTDQDLALMDAGFAPPRQRTRFLSFGPRTAPKSKPAIDATPKAKSDGIPPQKAHLSIFSERALPTPEQLDRAASTSVVAESGVRVRFGELWEQRKSIVIFIRHFRASHCQDYIRSLAAENELKALDKAGYNIIIVGLGSHTMINSYRQITGTKFPIFTDPTLSVHRALGMTFKATSSSTIHQNTIGCFYKSLKGVVSFRMPLFDRGGDISQLGGEFLLGPGHTCSYAHRMMNAQSHAPISDIIAAAAAGAQGAIIEIKPQRQHHSGLSIEDEEAWMARRRRSLARMRKKRQSRRAGTVGPNPGAGSGWTEGIHFFEEVKERFPILEEDEYSVTLEKKAELRIGH